MIASSERTAIWKALLVPGCRKSWIIAATNIISACVESSMPATFGSLQKHAVVCSGGGRHVE